jgi:DNA topoisomerase-1
MAKSKSSTDRGAGEPRPAAKRKRTAGRKAAPAATQAAAPKAASPRAAAAKAAAVKTALPKRAKGAKSTKAPRAAAAGKETASARAAGKALVIVESPTKSRTLTKFLGRGFAVMASNGHIMDLPKSKLGVDLENGFEPQYEPIKTKAQTLAKLQQAARTASRIYLAPDPDREGEAIAWHLAGALKSARRPIQRLTFNEITERAVQQALEHPRELDLNLVNAQQARRVLDRLVGYKVSPFLWKTMFFGLSAGRVQSVALRLICEREDAIEKFVAVEYWTLEVDYETAAGERFTARLARVGEEELEQAQLRGDQAPALAQQIAAELRGASAAAVHHQHAAADRVQPARVHEPAHHEDRAAALRGRGARLAGQRRPHHLYAHRFAAPGG